jgi:hypothetical protein
MLSRIIAMRSSSSRIESELPLLMMFSQVVSARAANYSCRNTRISASSRRRDLKQSQSMRTKRRPIAIMRRSCSDSPVTASQMGGVLWVGPPLRGMAAIVTPLVSLSSAMTAACLEFDRAVGTRRFCCSRPSWPTSCRAKSWDFSKSCGTSWDPFGCDGIWRRHHRNPAVGR